MNIVKCEHLRKRLLILRIKIKLSLIGSTISFIYQYPWRLRQVCLNKTCVKLSLRKQFIKSYWKSEIPSGKQKSRRFPGGRETAAIALSEICFVFHSPTISSARHSISYTRHDDRETRRLTIDLLRYRVERQFPSLDPRNSQCDSQRHLSLQSSLQCELLQSARAIPSRYCF